MYYHHQSEFVVVMWLALLIFTLLCSPRERGRERGERVRERERVREKEKHLINIVNETIVGHSKILIRLYYQKTKFYEKYVSHSTK